MLIALAPQSTGRGRSSIPLAVQSDCFFTLGVQLSRGACAVGLCDFGGHLLRYKEVTIQGDLILPIVQSLEELLENVDRRKILGIGIDAPGPVNSSYGYVCTFRK